MKQIRRYELRQELGRGGMAVVHAAFDPAMKREVAIKILPRQLTVEKAFMTRFRREAEAVAALEHAAIVPIYDFGEHEGQPFLVMRYMRGGSLADRLRDGPLPLAETERILQRLAPALDTVHAKGIIHRDLKPANILFDDQGDAYLADFGIVKFETNSSTTLTNSGGALGTPAYMSPEQARGVSELDGRSDLYSLGVILYEMLAGLRPYQSDTPLGLAYMHVHEPIPDILKSNPALPRWLGQLVTTALAKEPGDRFQTAAELVTAFGEKREKRASRQERVMPSRLRWAVVGGVALIGLVVLAATAFALINGANTDPTPLPTASSTVDSDGGVTTAEADFVPASVETPSTPTATLASPSATWTATATQTPSPTATATFSATPTIQVAVPITLTNTPTSTPAPVVAILLLAPKYGTYRSPILLQWSTVPGVSYQVTLHHFESDFYATSNWLTVGEYVYDLPGEKYGNWEWYVTSNTGVKSETGTFVFDPIQSGPQFSIYDLNHDCIIDQADVDIILAAFRSKPGDPNWNPDYDFDGDGEVGFTDVMEVVGNVSDKPYCTL
ncbi:MAG: protein kinase [Anaerolineales bacterium]|nr:protein kinase [Anaerolineales bacterium]